MTPTYVAWVPLAPGEIYYGYGYYGPWSRNIATVNMNAVAAKRTYVNARVNHSVVVVKRESFGTGRHTLVQIRENSFIEVTLRTEGTITIVPPLIKPRNPIFIVPPEIRDHVLSLPPRTGRA